MATATQHSIQLLHSGSSGGGSINGMPHGLGLLTTVASLPPKYRSRYLMNIKTKCEVPLDLSVKPISPQIASDVPIATAFAEVYTEPSAEADEGVAKTSSQSPSVESSHVSAANMAQEQQQRDAVEFSDDGVTADDAVAFNAITTTTTTTINIIEAASNDIVVKSITPPLTPTKRKYSHDENKDEADADAHENAATSLVRIERRQEWSVEVSANPAKLAKTAPHATIRRDATPAKPICTGDTAPRTAKSQPPMARPSKNKATRKLKFDEETSSPVSGTIIRPLEDITDGAHLYSNGDIDPKYNIVEITEETKAELAAIKNVIGDYICRLCRLKFDDAFGLARHRCACIVLLEYRCPECGKQFNCPANLASHRRWHKPKKEAPADASTSASITGANSSAAAKKENNRNTSNKATTVGGDPLRAAEQKVKELVYACDDCGKKFKRPAYLRKHQAMHASKVVSEVSDGGGRGCSGAVSGQRSSIAAEKAMIYHQTYVSASSLPSSSTSSVHSSCSGATNEDIYASKAAHATALGAGDTARGVGSNVGGTILSSYEYEVMDSMSDCSNSSSAPGYGRLQIIETVGLTEEENIAAAALTNLRNCASVIQHTTLAH